MAQPHIVALGGTLRAGSSTERALRIALDVAEARGARTTLLGGPDIVFPHYEPETALTNPAICRFVDVLRSADALVIGSPGYHGTLSGMVKNALDHVELMRADARVYFDGMPIGLVAAAGGWQAAVATLQALRTVTHALRGWPTPLGVAINTSEPNAVDGAKAQIEIMVGQMLTFLER
jgi:FMN reductase